MDKLRFTFAVLPASDIKTNIICITSIETPEGCIYEVPDELKNANKHTAITSSATYAKIKNSLKKRNQTRKIWIPLTDELQKIYLDAGENVQFGDQYLEEISGETRTTNNSNNKTEPEHKNLVKTAEKFLLEKFSGRTANVNQWISEFEAECERFEIIQDTRKIEILKHLLEKQCIDWYTGMIIKFTVKSEWSLWKENFCATYGNKGWSSVKYAYTFRYQTGSLLEYATKKERLLLEVNKDIDSQTLINLIVMGLPDYVMDKIDKTLVTSTANLCNEIGKQEYAVNKKNFTKSKKNMFDNKYKLEKTSCKICEKLNKGVRYHPEEKCWFRQSDDYENKKKHNKNINNTVLDVELNDENQKNE